ncbi:unnamed protein product [Brassica rapa subsp. trilocularis]
MQDVLHLGGLSGNIKRILDSLCFPSSPSPSIIAAPLTETQIGFIDEHLGFLQLVQTNASGNCQTSLPCNLKVDVLYFGLICKEVAKVVPAQTLADQELTETMQKLLIVMQRLDDKIGLMLESDGELFNIRWGFFSRAGLWDKSHLMRQIEKYRYLFSAFSEQLVVYLSHLLLSLKIGFRYADIYTHQESPTSSTTHPSCISAHKSSMSSKLISGDSDFFANLVCFHFSSLCSQSISAIEFPSRLWDPFIISCNSG